MSLRRPFNTETGSAWSSFISWEKWAGVTGLQFLILSFTGTGRKQDNYMFRTTLIHTISCFNLFLRYARHAEEFFVYFWSAAVLGNTEVKKERSKEKQLGSMIFFHGQYNDFFYNYILKNIQGSLDFYTLKYFIWPCILICSN